MLDRKQFNDLPLQRLMLLTKVAGRWSKTKPFDGFAVNQSEAWLGKFIVPTNR
jgi:hypothetical protein